MNKKIWMMSNRQPWVEALLCGLIRIKSRSLNVALPPPGSIVFLHASKALWSDYRFLPWADKMNVQHLQKGGICGVARCIEVAPIWDLKYNYDNDSPLFDLYRDGEYWTCCLDDQIIVFDHIRRLPFIPCRGVITPTTKLPKELMAELKKYPEWLCI